LPSAGAMLSNTGYIIVIAYQFPLKLSSWYHYLQNQVMQFYPFKEITVSVVSFNGRFRSNGPFFTMNLNNHNF
jgi:hypothetical protein